AGLLADARGNRGVYLDEDDLDIDLAALIEEARETSGAEADQDVRSVLVYRGDGSASRQHEEGNLVRVSFAEGPDVTLRASDQTALWGGVCTVRSADDEYRAELDPTQGSGQSGRRPAPELPSPAFAMTERDPHLDRCGSRSFRCRGAAGGS